MSDQPTTAEQPRGPAVVRRWRRMIVSALAIVMMAAVGWTAWKLRDSKTTTYSTPPAGAEDEVAITPPLNPGYLGSHACAACHAERVAEFESTRHFLACCPPKPDAMPSGFAPRMGHVASRVPGLRFEMTRDGDDFFQTAIRGTPNSEERTRSRIDLVYGLGGKADEIYFTWHGDRLRELPAAWLRPQQRWVTEPMNPHGSGDFSKSTTPRCLECHNTWLAHIPGTENQYKPDSFILGVTCERCHGPGRDHVEFHRAHPDVRKAKAVVHPGQLSRERQLDLCGQCHSNTTKRRGPAFSYRPGEPLEDHYRIAKVRHREEDHVADQVKYLKQSKCFQKNETMTCVTCHDPHRPNEPANVRRSCQKCHQAADCREQPRLPVGVRGQCVDCHMPQFSRIQVLFHTEDDQYVPVVRPYDHRIAVHPIARQEVLREWHLAQTDEVSRNKAKSLTKSLADHWLAEGEKFAREYRFIAAIGAAREALRFDPSPAAREKLKQYIKTQDEIDTGWAETLRQFEKGRPGDAAATLTRLVQLKPDLARAHGLLGTIHANARRRQQAIEHWHAAARHDPDDAGGWTMLAALALSEGRVADAVETYRKADEVEPFSATIKYHLGLSLARLERWDEASASFRKALDADPKHALAAQALSHSLTKLGRKDEALPFAERAARLSRYQNPHILLTLAETYAAAARPTDAAAIATKALDLPRTGDNALTPQLRREFEEIKSRARPGT